MFPTHNIDVFYNALLKLSFTTIFSLLSYVVAISFVQIETIEQCTNIYLHPTVAYNEMYNCIIVYRYVTAMLNNINRYELCELGVRYLYVMIAI